MRLSGYHAWDTKGMIPQSPVSTLRQETGPPYDVDGEVTSVPTASTNGASETTGAAALVTNFDVVRYCHEDLLLSVNQINDPKIALRHISDAQVPFLVQAFRVFKFARARGTLSVTTTVTASRCEEYKGTQSTTPLVLDEASPEALLDGRHRI